MQERITFKCSTCEKVHEGLPAIAFDAPWAYYTLPQAERSTRAVLTSDMCVIDNEEFFVRAVLEVPIVGHSETLEWGVWGSLSNKNFERYEASFFDNDQSKLGAMFSWFSSKLPGYDLPPEGLRCQLIPRDDRQRPSIEFHPDDTHALVLDKKNGISLERAIAFVIPVLHKQ
jgi:hypothetical protein